MYFTFNPTSYGKEKTQRRLARDRDILLQEVADNPHNSRCVFFLAQTYAALDDWQNALKWYEHRISMTQADEEVFMSLCRAGLIYFYKNDAFKNYEKITFNFLKAFSLCSYRAEPLTYLAYYFYQIKAYPLCFLCVHHASKIPYDSNCGTVIDKEVYDFSRFDLLSAVAERMGEYEIGLQATLKALEARPDLQHLYKNLSYYESKLAQNIS